MEKIRRELEMTTDEYELLIVGHGGYIKEEGQEKAKLIVTMIALAKNLVAMKKLYQRLGSKLMLGLDCRDADTDCDGLVSLDKFTGHLKNIE